MAKRKKGQRQTPAEKRMKRLERLMKANPRYGKATAQQTGAMGYSRFQGGTKPREGPAIIVINPKDPSQGRVARIGKRGGVYGQGGTPKTRWGELKTITKALPGAALVTAAAGVGAMYIKDSKMVSDLRKKVPGGNNTLALGAGAVIGYLGYKYRSLLFFLSACGIMAYSIIKLATGQSNLKMESGADEEDLLDTDETETPQLEQKTAAPTKPEESGAPPDTTPKKPSGADLAAKKREAKEAKRAAEESGSTPEKPKGPNPKDAAERSSIKAGHNAMKAGDFPEASAQYAAAYSQNKNATILYWLGRSFDKRAMAAFAKQDLPRAEELANAATINYNAFINEARVSALASPDELGDMKVEASARVKKLKDMGDFAGPDPDAGSFVAGSTVYVEGDDDEEYEEVEGDDDEEYEEVEGQEDEDEDDDIEGYEVEGDDDDVYDEEIDGDDDEEYEEVEGSEIYA